MLVVELVVKLVELELVLLVEFVVEVLDVDVEDVEELLLEVLVLDVPQRATGMPGMLNQSKSI